MKRPVVLDLFCGMGGWAAGFHAEGWYAIGIDVHRFTDPRIPPYPGQLIIADVRQVDGERFRGKIDLIVASPPCEQFTRLRLPFRSCRRFGPPDLSLVQATYRIALQAGAPLVLENVAGAVPFLGPPRHRFGPFYLWGDGVPFLLPQVSGSLKTKLKIPFDDNKHSFRAAFRAKIPDLLSRHVARWHEAH